MFNISWWCAKAYRARLSQMSGQTYRLLSEAEWEYACRAGTTTPFWTGDTISRLQANYDSEQTTPVDAFPANPWKLHDLHGNVFGWVEDCANKSYRGAPVDGSPWLRGDCDRRRLRGGCWGTSDVAKLSSSSRNWGGTSFRNHYIGFRVARTLTP